MAVSARALGQAFAAIVGAGAVREGERVGAIDGVLPRWSVAPASVPELARVVALAREEGLPVVPRGSGSALALGHPPARPPVLVELRRLDEVLEYNPDDLTATVQAGTTLDRLAALLAPRAQALPLDPPGGATRTMGGIAATGASGPLRLRYGTMRDLLLGIRFVQADGVVTWGGAKVVKSVTGYDVPKLMVGALGTLGILAELTVRLHPAPACERASLASFSRAEAAQEFVAAIADSPLEPNRVEWLNAVASRPWGVRDAAAAIAVSVGSVESAARAQEARLDELARGAGGAWRSLEGGAWPHAIDAAADRPDAIALRVASLASRLAETVRGVESAVGRIAPAATVAVTGCAPLGVLRARVLGASAAEGAALVAQLRDLVAPAEGTVVVEAASPALRGLVDPWGPVPPDVLSLMRSVKEQFDPDGTLNPGRFVGGL